MAALKVDADPGEVGFDADRLRRIDTHFRRSVDDGRLARLTVAVTRRGRVVHLSHHGLADLETGRPVADDTLWRIYSMAKPVTSAANPATVPATEPLRVWHLLTHTAGLTYGFHHAHPADEMYRAKGFDFGVPRGMDLAAACDVWAGIPLLFELGSEWNYSVATDVLGRVVEVASGQSLDAFFGARLLSPRTVAYMTRNHLPGGVDLESFGRPIFAESSFRGVGSGLGFSVVTDAAAGKVLGNAGEYAWGGLASTAFTVDPVEETTAMFFTQLVPSSTYPIRSALRALVNQALVD